VQLGATPEFSGGRLSVLVGPIDANMPDEILANGRYTAVGGTDTIANQSTYSVSVQIPGDVPDGVWQAFFSFAVPNGSSVPLIHGRQIFRVQRHKYSGAPKWAASELQ